MKKTEASDSEVLIWSGNPSLIAGGWIFIFSILFVWSIVPIFISLYEFLRLRSINYAISTQRVRITSGLITKRIEEIELYRVRDLTVSIPFLHRMYGVADIELIAKDVSAPNVTLMAIPNAEVVKEKIRFNVEALRGSKRRIV